MRRVATASVASFSCTMRPPALVPTTPGSRPPWPASRNTVLLRWPCVGAKLMHVPASRPGIGGCEPVDVVVLPLPSDCRKASMTRGIARTSVAMSAQASAVRNRAEGACRRRGRAETWREFAIGPRSVPGSGSRSDRDGSADAAVLRQGGLLRSGGVDIEQHENDHELFVLPNSDIEGLVGDRDREHDRVWPQSGVLTFHNRYLRGLQRRGAEADYR